MEADRQKMSKLREEYVTRLRYEKERRKALGEDSSSSDGAAADNEADTASKIKKAQSIITEQSMTYEESLAEINNSKKL